jgi:quinol monooxygenase YgiN
MTPSVSLHPYFKVHPGKMDAARALLPRFIEKTNSEPAVLHYEFTINGDEVFCREAYKDAAGALAHLSAVGNLLTEMLQNADLIRVEVHGPASELETMKAPLAHLPIAWFVWECALNR